MNGKLYEITHNPVTAHSQEGWTLDMSASGRATIWFYRQEDAQAEADKRFPRSAVSLKVFTGGRVVINAAYHSDMRESLDHLRMMIEALEAEIVGATNCPTHAAQLPAKSKEGVGA